MARESKVLTASMEPLPHFILVIKDAIWGLMEKQRIQSTHMALFYAFDLTIIQLIVFSLCSDQLIMCTAFDDAALLQNHDTITVSYC